MFELESAIWEWRREMMASGVNASEILDEIEAHLRDHVQNQVAIGASEEAAFKTAIANLGDAATLAKEFAQNDRGKSSPPRFLQTAYWVTALLLLLINTCTLLVFQLSSRQRLVGIVGVVLVTCYLASVPRWLKSRCARSVHSVGIIVKAVANLLWVCPVVALLAAKGVIHMEPGIVPMVLVWCVYMAVVLTVVAFGFNERPEGDPGGNAASRLEPKPGPTLSPRAGGDFNLLPAAAVDPIMEQCLRVAREEASRLGHEFIGTEHLLLAILKLAGGPLTNLLRKTGLSSEVVRRQVEALIRPTLEQSHSTREAPFTPRARKALRLAAREAKRMKHSLVGVEHLFLGLLSEGSGIGAQALRKLGVHIETARWEIQGELGAASVR